MAIARGARDRLGFKAIEREETPMFHLNLRSKIFALAAGALIGAGAVGSAVAADYELDPSHAHVVFQVSHLGYATTVGQFEKIDAKVSVDWDAPAEGKLEVTIDAASVDSNWPARDEHLRKADFLHVEKYPTIEFVSTDIEVTGENTALITGNLTLLGQTRPVTLVTELNKHGPHPMTKRDHFGVSATTMIKRSDYGMTYAVPMVGDEVELRIEAEFMGPENPAEAE
ncbi:MAG: hypothetical protein Tsb0016_23020 [Sphingomonadales bacterium]